MIFVLTSSWEVELIFQVVQWFDWGIRAVTVDFHWFLKSKGACILCLIDRIDVRREEESSAYTGYFVHSNALLYL